nr:unnamed protein product [Spirometra erinaceieuropaei]
MPLLNGEPFVKKSPAPHMNPDDEVFFSPITFEIFQDYDEFFERTILLNSATWNCSFCNKSQLTYTEAVACEKSDLDQLNNFGVALCRGLLYITFQARRRKLSELVDLLHGFVHYRFFVGESVFVKRSDFKTAANQCVVIERVLPPPGRDCKKTPEPSPANAPECMNTPPELPDPSVIKYVVKRSATTGPAHCSVPENSSSMILSGSVLQRGPKNFLTRDKIKFFIRQTCELEFSVFKPKKSIMEHFNLEPFGSLSWTDFFVAPEPLWYDLAPPPVSLIKPKMLRIDTAPPKAQPSHQSAQMGNTGGISDCSGGGGGGGAPLKKLAYSPRVPSSQQQPKIVVSVGRAQSFEENQAQAARAARLAALDADRLLRMERADLERDWALLRKREDLELSDLIPLPDFTEVSTRLPVEEFGRAIQILEFLNIYGWQRWLSSVASTTSISQLHLLTRALERAARRAARGGRGVPAAIFSYASQIPLPEIRCTACGGPPDSNPAPTRGPGCSLTGAFSVCSACACPFHLDCLLCSRARTPSSRNFRPRAASRVSARASELSALPLARHLASPYTLLGALLGSASATRAELTGLSLLLCDRCRRLAGYPVSETFVEASATCVPPPPAPSVVVADVDTTASTDTTAAAAGGGDASIASDSPLGTSDISMTVSPRRTSRSTLHENGPLSTTFSPPRGRQKRGRPPSSSSSLTNRTVGRGRGRGRPPKRPRFHLEEANHAEHDDRRREEAAEEEEDLEAGLGGRSGADAVRRDPADCVHYDDEEDAFLQHRAESSDPVASSPRLNGEFTRGAKLAASRKRSGAPTSAGVEEQSDGTCAAEFGLNHQAAAERFLAEISSLSVARPLIRCALGRTVLSEERNSSSSLWQFPPPQPTTAGDNSSYRTRRTTQGCGAAADGCSPGASSLYAYDLDGLTDLLSRRALPRGPGEVVSQLRLLIRHFINSNRPGSRLHHCAQDLAAYVERRLSELGQQNSAVEDADGGSFRVQPTLP